MHRPVFRVGTVSCPATTLGSFLYNDIFRILKGAEYFVDGCLTFASKKHIKRFEQGRPVFADGTYRTVFGPSISHNGVIYENSDDNVSLALSRLTAARFPDIPGEHDKYKNLQRTYIDNNLTFLDSLCETYSKHFTAYTCADIEAEEHHSDPHPKKALRQQSWQELNETGDRYSRLWLKKVKYKMKKNEIAKPGKVPRMIGDLGVAASLQGFRTTKFLKNAQAAEPVVYKEGTIEFIASPDPGKLEEVFAKLLDPPGRYYMALFSDDSCFSIRTPTGVDVYNVDISKCDASHTERLFDALVLITPSQAREDMKVLTEQCELPIQLQSLYDKKRSVLLQPKHKLLYSGSTLTTAINNLANILIGKAFADCEYSGPDSLMLAAKSAGYVITLESCDIPEDIQFLKHSPVFDTMGRMRPLMNLGVLLRLSGTCNGDLPGRGDLQARAVAFQDSLLQGAYPYANFTILDNLKAECGGGNLKTQAVCDKMFEYKVCRSGYEVFTADPRSLYKRYRLTDLEISDIETFATLGYQGHFSGPSVDKILGKDYGLASQRP